MRIGLISDTHGHLDPKVIHHFDDCDEIWHAGDIGSHALADTLENFRPLRAVFGNIDDAPMRTRFPEDLWFKVGGLTVWMTHIGGAPPNYNTRIKQAQHTKLPDIFICGHSHILRIQRDEKLRMLYINPGAAGIHGFHKVKTIVRFSIEDKIIKDMQVIELGMRGSISGDPS